MRGLRWTLNGGVIFQSIPGMMCRRKLLLSAYACEPGRGSEPEVGWRWATSLAKLHEVTVVTRANNREPIETALRKLQSPHPKFIYYDLPAAFLKLKRAGMPVALYYLFWQIGVRIAVRKHLEGFDIIHHVTFNSFRQPGLWWFCGKPVVLGPLGGGQTCPSSFLSLMRESRLSEIFRTVSVVLSPLLPHLWLCFASARLVLAANADTENRIPTVFRKKVHRLLETGIPAERIQDKPRTSSGEEIRILWLGWFIQIKAPELALRAFAKARKRCERLSLTMAGDGALGASLKGLAAELGVADCVHWAGKVPHDRVAELMARHDAFIFTSLRDTSGNVLLEAMASGLPAITLLHQGAAEIATDETAIRVKPGTIDQTVRDLADAMVRLAESRAIRERLGEAGRQRIRQVFEWDKQAEHMSGMYEKALTKAGLSNCV